MILFKVERGEIAYYIILNYFSGGALSERFGGKILFLIGMVLSVIFTLNTPPVTDWGGATGLIVIRILLGLSQGVMYASAHSLMAAWIPLNIRMISCAMAYNGIIV